MAHAMNAPRSGREPFWPIPESNLATPTTTRSALVVTHVSGTIYYRCVRVGHKTNLAEREGFEPPIRLPVCRISSAVLSTTQPPLQPSDLFSFSI
jgi:hypothetical protein